MDALKGPKVPSKATGDAHKENNQKTEKSQPANSIGKTVSGLFGGIFGSRGKISQETPPPLPIVQYFVAIDGKQTGPFDMSALVNMVKEGTLGKQSLVWKKGMNTWEKAETVDELKQLFDEDTTIQPPPLPSI